MHFAGLFILREGLMKNGDVVFFKRAKASAHRKAPEVMFKGHAFGVMLGHVPPFAKNPPAAYVISQLGSIGYISFDDIGEFLGEDVVKQLALKFEAKYTPKPADPATATQQELPLDGDPAADESSEPEVLRPSGIVGLNGKPIEDSHGH